MTYSAKAVANFFIKKAISEDKNTLTRMKLLKLVYIAQGCYLAIYDKDLIDEPIKAWRYGPVIEGIYKEFGFYGHRTIDSLAYEVRIGKNKETIWDDYPIPEKDKDTIIILEEVWKTYNKYNGIQLSNWSHTKGSPWDQVYKNSGQNAIIPSEIIKEYFKENIVNGKNV